MAENLADAYGKFRTDYPKVDADGRGDRGTEGKVLTNALSTCLARLAPLHHHLCPRQVLGARMGLYAGEILGLELPRTDRRLFVLIETDGCLADSVSAATGCSLGHRTMRLVDHGKTAATFVDTVTASAIRISPHPAARSRASEYVPAARGRWHAQRDAYQLMPSTELLRAERVSLEVDLAAIISRPGRRVTCAACGEEIMNEREIILDGYPYCRGCSGEPYYRIRDDEEPSLELARGSNARMPAQPRLTAWS